MLKEIISKQNLENAYSILCKQRKNYSAYADIWDLRHKWPIYKKDIKTQITAGTYNFNPVTQYTDLSPLLSAVALLCWDEIMQKYGFTYARFMDDLIVLTKTRAKLRKAIKLTYAAIKPWG